MTLSKAKFLAIFLVLAAAACGDKTPQTPVETFKTYVMASKKKDVRAMKVLLSSGTLKMHEQQAKAQNTTVDEIIKRETLLADGQKGVDYKDEKIEGDKATVQFKNPYGTWETMPFVKEDGEWKIDKQGYAEQMIKEIEDQQNDVFDGPALPPAATPEVR